jgi:serine/threonine protein kinase
LLSCSDYFPAQLHLHVNHLSSHLPQHFESHREIAVLKEVSHPRIVRILDSIEDKDDAITWSPYCMILSYCQGPTVEQLINHGGALGIHMAKEISYQLIDAVSYLNGHAVIHRDIKVSNMLHHAF